jgi:hypothetical protein
MKYKLRYCFPYQNSRLKMEEVSLQREIALEGGILSEESQFVSNEVITSRYILLALVPKNLFEQFHRAANIWFLFVSIL